MGKYLFCKECTVLGTDEFVYIKPMAAVTAREYRQSTLAMLVPADDAKEPAKPEDMEAMQRENLRVHCYADQEGSALVWDSLEAMESEETGLSAAQIQDLILQHLAISGFTTGATETARRFPDSPGEAGGVPSAPNGGGGVRPAE
jgi:hypothetical protein